LGASYPLKEKRQKIWKNATASEVVTEIAVFNKLKPVVTKCFVLCEDECGFSYF
jgi:phage protein D